MNTLLPVVRAGRAREKKEINPNAVALCKRIAHLA
jgi:hypothetical protein